jgi:hypothetical protein
VSSFFLTGVVLGTTTTTVETEVDTNSPDTAFRWDWTGRQAWAARPFLTDTETI